MHSRSLLSALAAACLLAFTWPAAEAATVTHTLTMDSDPLDAGWTLHNDGGSHSVAGGTLRVEAPTFYEFFAPAADWIDRASNAAGWVVEARFRRDPTSNGTPGLWAGDDRFVTILGLGSTGLELGDGSSFVGSYALDTSVFHTYKLLGLRDRLAVFVDDVFALSLDAVPESGGTNTFAFGDNNRFTTGPGLSFSEWDYISLTTTPGPRYQPPPAPIPLPAGIWLLGSGLLALGGVAARRKAQANKLRLAE